jgi:hypothetical protein
MSPSSRHATSLGVEPATPGPAFDDVCATVAPIFEGRVGASRNDLLWTATNAWAGPETISLLMTLPSNFYGTLADLQQHLERLTE